MPTRQCNGVLSHQSLTSGGVRGDHDAVALLLTIHSSLLEIIELVGVLNSWILNKLLEVHHTDFVCDDPVLFLRFLTIDRRRLRELFQWPALSLLRKGCQVEM